MPYSVRLAKGVCRQLKRLPFDLQKRVVFRMEALAFNPRPFGVQKLAGERNAYRIRVGDYRILYEIHDKILVVAVMKVVRRDDAYR